MFRRCAADLPLVSWTPACELCTALLLYCECSAAAAGSTRGPESAMDASALPKGLLESVFYQHITHLNMQTIAKSLQIAHARMRDPGEYRAKCITALDEI